MVKRKKGDHEDPEDKLRETIIGRDFKVKFWRKVKFVQNDAQLTQVCGKVMDYMGLGKGEEEDKEVYAIRLNTFELKFGDKILQEVNNLRSYVLGQLRDVATHYMDQNGGRLPQIADLEKVVFRDPTMDMDLMEWWWDEVLPKATGYADCWKESKRWFGTITRLAPPDDIKKKYITAETEAFALLNFENSAGKWEKHREISQLAAFRNKNITILYKKTPAENPAPKTPRQAYAHIQTYPGLKTKWTQPNAGQAKFGGWSKEGMTRYSAILKACKEGRANQPQCDEIEQKALASLREKHGIEATILTYEDYQKARGRSKPKKAPKEAIEAVDGCLNMEDDDW